jgi:hypothetical protein
MVWAGHVTSLEDLTDEIKVSAGNSKGKRITGRPKRGFECGIKMDFKEIVL